MASFPLPPSPVGMVTPWFAGRRQNAPRSFALAPLRREKPIWTGADGNSVLWAPLLCRRSSASTLLTSAWPNAELRNASLPMGLREPGGDTGERDDEPDGTILPGALWNDVGGEDLVVEEHALGSAVALRSESVFCQPREIESGVGGWPLEGLFCGGLQ